MFVSGGSLSLNGNRLGPSSSSYPFTISMLVTEDEDEVQQHQRRHYIHDEGQRPIRAATSTTTMTMMTCSNIISDASTSGFISASCPPLVNNLPLHCPVKSSIYDASSLPSGDPVSPLQQQLHYTTNVPFILENHFTNMSTSFNTTILLHRFTLSNDSPALLTSGGYIILDSTISLHNFNNNSTNISFVDNGSGISLCSPLPLQNPFRNKLQCYVRPGVGHSPSNINTLIAGCLVPQPDLSYHYNAPHISSIATIFTPFYGLSINGNNFGNWPDKIKVVIPFYDGINMSNNVSCVNISIIIPHSSIICSLPPMASWYDTNNINRNNNNGSNDVQVYIIVGGQSSPSYAWSTHKSTNLLQYEAYPLPLITSETGAPAQFSVRLISNPQLAVITVEFKSSDYSFVDIIPSRLIFDYSNYERSQVVTVRGKPNDPIMKTNYIAFTITGSAFSSSPNNDQDVFSLPALNARVIWPDVFTITPSVIPPDHPQPGATSSTTTTITISGAGYKPTSTVAIDDVIIDNMIYINERTLVIEAPSFANLSRLVGSLNSHTRSLISSLPHYASIKIYNHPEGTSTVCDPYSGIYYYFTPGHKLCDISTQLYYSDNICYDTVIQHTNDTSTSSSASSSWWWSSNDDGSGGVCLPCPTDIAICPGGGRIWPKSGFWSPSEFTLPRACPFPGACPGGGPNRCTLGYQGAFCSACLDESYYPFRENPTQCASCLDPTRALSYYPILVAASIYFTCIAIAGILLRNSAFDSLVAILVGVQQIVQIAGTGTDSNVMGAFFSQFNWILFDFQWLHPKCTIGYIKFTQVWLGTVVSMFVFLIFFVIISVFRSLFLMAVGKRIARKIRSLRMLNSKMSKVCVFLLSFMVDYGKYLKQIGEVSTSFHKPAFVLSFHSRLLRSWLVVMLLLYVNVTKRTVQGMHCVEVNGQWRLNAELSTICYEGTHLILIPFIWLVFLVYSIGLPVVCLGMVVRNSVLLRASKDYVKEQLPTVRARLSRQFSSFWRKSNYQFNAKRETSFDHQLFDEKFGYIWRDLRPGFRWFRIINILFSFVIAVEVGVALDESVQKISNGTLFAAILIPTVWFMPFKNWTENIVFIGGGIAKVVAMIVVLGSSSATSNYIYLVLGILAIPILLLALRKRYPSIFRLPTPLQHINYEIYEDYMKEMIELDNNNNGKGDNISNNDNITKDNDDGGSNNINISVYDDREKRLSQREIELEVQHHRRLSEFDLHRHHIQSQIEKERDNIRSKEDELQRQQSDLDRRNGELSTHQFELEQLRIDLSRKERDLYQFLSSTSLSSSSSSSSSPSPSSSIIPHHHIPNPNISNNDNDYPQTNQQQQQQHDDLVQEVARLKKIIDMKDAAFFAKFQRSTRSPSLHDDDGAIHKGFRSSVDLSAERARLKKSTG
eukprot:TRINITY_DN4586_c1_g1_i7.p1 TRINITY_DN4586_c1_g1~~TRINITY_DN4586_c1_g1_i7.p1  ORF type:complete len:1405 (-),score=234.04 TRINITY_DN4586_c1_g1_i7:90-4304(-)